MTQVRLLLGALSENPLRVFEYYMGVDGRGNRIYAFTTWIEAVASQHIYLQIWTIECNLILFQEFKDGQCA